MQSNRYQLEQEALKLRPRVFQTCHNLADEVGHTLYFSHHFLSRFDVRSINPVNALNALEVLVRAFARAPKEFQGREGAVGVGEFVFIVKDQERQGRKELTFITFWAAKEGIARLDLFGRDDVIKLID
jgi:hypothetical protein